MPLNQDRARDVFEKLGRNLGKLSARPTPKNVHQFRTCSRRLQALLEELVPELSRNERKLHKLVSRLRKRVGKIRDFDAQISALRTLKLSDKDGSKAQLLRALTQARSRRVKKLDRAFDRETIRELGKRLKRVRGAIQVPQNAEPLRVALRLLAGESQDRSPLTEERLHQYRILGKRARYLVEFAVDTPETHQAIEQLKRMQDALGDWHDWLTLTQSAQERFGGVQQSALVAALHNLTRTRFRRAVEVVMQTRAALLDTPVEIPRRTVTPAPEAARAAIA